MTTSYLDEALRACRLPIRVRCDIVKTTSNGPNLLTGVLEGSSSYLWTLFTLQTPEDVAISMDHNSIKEWYVDIRNHLLAEQKENDNAKQSD